MSILARPVQSDATGGSREDGRDSQRAIQVHILAELSLSPLRRRLNLPVLPRAPKCVHYVHPPIP